MTIPASSELSLLPTSAIRSAPPLGLRVRDAELRIRSASHDSVLRLLLPEGELLVRSVSEDSPLRLELEDFIRTKFHACFEARISNFLPELLGFYDSRGEIQAGVGLRNAAQGPLFLEQYLSDPIEDVLAKRLGIPIDRDAIVEIGNLAAARPGLARPLLQALTLQLAARGTHWVAFTGTRRVFAACRRMGLAPFRLGAADPRRLGEAASDWGHYYASNPQVAAGFVPSGLRAVEVSLFDPEQLRSLLRRAEVWIH